MEELSDEALMARVVEGDRGAFRTLVERHMRVVLSLAQRIMKVPADADELAQETFLKVLMRPALFNPSKARFTTWLHRVTVNLCIDRQRTRAEHYDGEVQAEPAADLRLADLVEAGERRAALNTSLMALPVRQRTAIVLFYMQELSQREAASIMNVSEGAFESLLQRGRSSLALALRPHANPESNS